MLLPGKIEYSSQHFKVYSISFRHLLLWTLIMFLIMLILFAVFTRAIFHVKLAFPFYLIFLSAIFGFMFAKRSQVLFLKDNILEVVEKQGIFKDVTTININNIKIVKLIEDPAPKAPFGLWALIWPAQSIMLQLLWKRFDVVGVFTKSGKLKKIGMHLTLQQTQKLTEYIKGLNTDTNQ
ncbi:MAG: hypothetical protein ACO3EE_04925 [Flavobacteriales bacterium]